MQQGTTELDGHFKFPHLWPPILLQAGRPELDRDGYLEALARRMTICREWAVSFERYPVLLIPNSWQRQFAVDADTVSVEGMNRILSAQRPLLGTAMMGLPGLSLLPGLHCGLRTGVQRVAGRLREDLGLRAGELVEQATRSCALDHLPGRQ